eukprot:COSAG02_NODE_3044_length_7482_cov_3.060680_6_plen_56_part_00
MSLAAPATTRSKVARVYVRFENTNPSIVIRAALQRQGGFSLYVQRSPRPLPFAHR